ncbi:UNVERIFIED_ORG: hypothetical protein GGI63_006110 [Rhizobium esperanzae]
MFRLSLKPKEMRDLFDTRAADGSLLRREEWIRLFFSVDRPFVHYSSNFVYRPEAVQVPGHPDLLGGWVAREIRHSERTPPEEGLEPTIRQTWQALFIAIDPTDHPDGQLLVIEGNDEIGRPKALVRAIVKAMNDADGSPYFTQVFPLVNAGSFWEFARIHREEIVSLTFDVAAPNMFNDANDFQEELRSLRDQENVSEVKTTLKSDTILAHSSSRIKDIVNYVERGAGELSAEAADGSRYSSTQYEVKETVEIESHSRNMSKFLREIGNVLSRFFP